MGEDAATFRGGTNYYVIGGGARTASDKVFQHNGPGTVHISGFYAENIGKLYRACGNCSTLVPTPRGRGQRDRPRRRRDRRHQHQLG